MVELATLLVGVVVPLIIGPLSVFCKSLWDRYSKSKELKVKNRYEKKIGELTDKINLFYWPVYLKLKTLDRINYHISQSSPTLLSTSIVNSNNNDNYKNDNNNNNNHKVDPDDITLSMGKLGDTTLSELSSDGNGNEIEFRKKRKHKNKKCVTPGCKRINRNPQLSALCHQCKIKLQKNEKNSDYPSSNIQMSSISSGIQETNLDHTYILETETYTCGQDKTVSNEIIDSDLEWQPEPFPKRTGHSIRHIKLHNDFGLLDSNLVVSVDRLFLSNLDTKILKLCMEIKEMTETNISIIQPSRKLVKEIIKFTRYTEMLEIIQITSKENNKKYNIESLGVVNNTDKLTLLIKSDLDKYMAEYSQTFDDYNETSLDSCCARK